MKFWVFKNYWWFFSLITFFISIGLYLMDTTLIERLMLPLIGTYLSLMYFIQKQRLEETKLFREIFAECNKRYDGLNDQLSEVIWSNGEDDLSPEQIKLLDDYFNLCAEEYLYYKQGYIYPDVWDSWENGMKTIVLNPRIHEYWKKESATGSYYGLDI